MKLIRNILYATLIVLAVFQSISTILGGIALLANVISMPVELLQGSPFKDYTIPGLALSLLAGGSSLFASILLFRRSKFAILFSTTAGVVMMFFEFVEVLVIGSPAGVARTLQIVYFGTGTALVVAAMGIWFLDLQSN
jgi:hypothetical protein